MFIVFPSYNLNTTFKIGYYFVSLKSFCSEADIIKELQSGYICMFAIKV